MPGDFGDALDGRHSWEGTVDPLAPSVANGQITPAEYEEYKRKRRRAAILGFGSTIGGMLLAGPAASALVGGAPVVGGASGAGTSGVAPAAAGYSSPGIFSGVSFGAPTAAATTAGGTATTAATGGSMGLMDRLLPTLIGAGAQGVTNVANMRANSKGREADERLTRDKMAQDRELDEEQMALDESKLDPFRTILAQIAAAQALDRVANTQPLDFTGNPYASFIPQGGYRPSAELQAGAGTARTTALAGQGTNAAVTPRATPPAVMDLIANSRPPGRAPVSSTMPVPGVSRMPDIDNFGLTGAVDPMAPSYLDQQQAPPRRVAMRRPRPRARMTVAA